ncbi:Uroporphyrinogen decarboxylase [Acididesulfobacillus acetoxydans]|uniref:Uroporphyrinogen decarboxylase n=1 Tax=Acididesulfobacillus acetoxydans TaxID=1561005 RepID=A0A8S0WX73_9FIRM|nr:uroporphyrinogen decarboxylase family protein [Acididesulfobacillus acetoxydans]CAA7600781.1 Uroporphyrinogen decarboxylase [Acididesulfobacillus acetoxydans]CEJ08629.1 Uroporphyrinogen-III decarboxylase-like protein [Acididesulfobacillus acetoxydans]
MGVNEVPDKDQMEAERQRAWVARSITGGVKERVPKGELCIADSLIEKALNCRVVGFRERYAFVKGMNLDIVTIGPVYPEQGKRLPGPNEIIWPELKEWIAETSLFTFALLDGAFEWGLRTLGFQDFLLLPHASPLQLNGHIRAVEEVNTAQIRLLAESGVDGIILADDIAFPNGLMLRPQVLKEHFFPSLARQAALAAKAGLSVFYHSDGRYGDVIEDVIASGFAGLHCIDRASGMEMESLRAKVGNRLCLWGHLDAGDAERAGDPAVREELTRSAWQLARNERFILGTNSGLYEGMDIEGLRALYRSIDGLPN